MSHLQLLTSAFALMTLAIALAVGAPIRIGSEIECVVAAIVGLSIALLPGAWIASRIRRESTQRLLLGLATIAALAAPAAMQHVSRIALDLESETRELAALVPFALLVCALLGPLLLVAYVATGALGFDVTRHRFVLEPAAHLAAGAALALAASPLLIQRAPGIRGSAVLAAILFACVLASRWIVERAEDVKDPPLRFGLALGPLVFAIGLVCGRTSALIDVRFVDTAFGGSVGPMLVAAGVCCGILFARAVAPKSAPNSPVILALAPWLAAGTAIGRILPRPFDSTRFALITLAGVAVLAVAFDAWRRRDRRVLITSLAGGAVLVYFGAREAPFSSADTEADGAHFAIRPLEDGRPAAWLEGAPLHVLEPDPYAAARIMCLTLCSIDEPTSVVVLGAGGAPYARALRLATDCDVTWVTPLAAEAASENDVPSERLTIVAARERSWLERDSQLHDLIVLLPPTRGRRAISRSLTREFGQLALDHLSPRGVVCQLYFTGAMTGMQLVQQSLPTMGFDHYRCFIDHPSNPAPLLARIVGPGGNAPLLEQFSARLPEVNARLPALSDADLDLFGLLQCYVFDDQILDLWYSESWTNEDDQPRFAHYVHTRPIAHAIQRAHTLRTLFDRRVSIAESQRTLSPNSPGYSELYASVHPRIRDDHAAVQNLMTTAIQHASRGSIALVPGAIAPQRDLPALLSAFAASPNLLVVARAIERVLGAALDRKDHATATAILDVVDRVEPDRLDTKLRRAELEARRGRLAASERAYREILARDPDHTAASVNLAFLLSGYGDSVRRQEAKQRLEAAIANDGRGVQPLDPMSRAIAHAILLGLSGDLAGARREIQALPPVVRALASLQYLDLPRRSEH